MQRPNRPVPTVTVTLHTVFTTSVPIRRVPLSPLVASVEADYVERFGPRPDHRGGWYHGDDWARISFVLDALDGGGRFLDVGLGAGQFINAVARTRRYETVVGADPVRFGKYVELEPGIVRHDESIAALPFADDSFDVVTCMEVLEHLPTDVFAPGLAELRRVCRGQLLMTVPFEEPMPLSPSHVRRFTAADIAELFPTATAVLLDRPRMPWALLEERPGPSTLARVAAETVAVTGTRRLPHAPPVVESLRRRVGRAARRLYRRYSR